MQPTKMPKIEGEPVKAKVPTSAGTMRRVGCGLIVGTLAGLLVTLAILRWRMYDPTPPLSAEALRAARQRWRERGPADYDIEIRVEGPQPGTYQVTVRGGQATSALRNGQPLTQKRTLGTWSVPGMFATINRDLEQVERRAGGNADRFTGALTLRASFEPELGYPQRYMRMESGSTRDVSWEVTRFEAWQTGE
jgi:hypothetical protein